MPAQSTIAESIKNRKEKVTFEYAVSNAKIIVTIFLLTY